MSSRINRVKTRDEVLVDNIYESPVDRHELRARRRNVLVLLVLVLVLAVWIVGSLRVDRPAAYNDIIEHFKYGSIGSKPGGSLLQPIGGGLPPYWGAAIVEYLKSL